MKQRPAVLIALAILALVILYFLLWPVPIDPEAWTPDPVPPLTGDYAVNDRMADLEMLGEGMGIGPEEVILDPDGRIYTGLIDGRIMRLNNDGTGLETFADTGGRPLGMAFDADGNLIVADSYAGLLSIAPSGQIATLSTEQGGVPYALTNDVVIADDGTIYFTDTSSRFPYDQYTIDLLEHRPNGRVLAYHPDTGETTFVLGDVYYANGITISPDQDYLLVNEMGEYRILKIWLNGPQAGETEVWLDNLPGFNDNIASNGQGIYWLAFVSPRKKDVDTVLLPNPFLRKVVVRLPPSMLPAAEDYGFVLGLNADGEVVYNLQDPSGGYRQNSSVNEFDGMLYFGSIVEDAIARMPAP